jgi:hypothetical protein
MPGDHFYGSSMSVLSKINRFATTNILQQLSSLETFKDRIDFAEKHLAHLSSGSSRIIYLTDDKQVLKLAKNERGIAQNKVESKIKSSFVNETTKSDKNGIWKLSPYCDKITEKDFEKLTNVSFKEFGQAIEHGISDEKKPKDFDKISKSDIYKEIIRLNKEYKLLPGDLIRISSWGVNKGVPVLLDAGLTRNVYDEFYTTKEKTKTKTSEFVAKYLSR